MSYILDALKKAEEARGAEEPVTVSGQAPAEPRRKHRSYWPYLLVAALAINAMIFVWRPWGTKKTVEMVQTERKPAPSVEVVRERFDDGEKITTVPPAPVKNQDTRENAVQETHTLALPRAADRPAKDRIDEAVRTEKRAVQSGSRSSAGGKKSAEVPPVSRRETEPPVGAKPSVATPDSKDLAPADPGRIYRVGELPESLRKDLPDLSLALHYYTGDPSSRLVNVGDRTLREGDELAAGLKLEEITRNSAIFSYRNYRFRVGIHQ